MSSSLLRSRGSAAAGGCSSLLVGMLGCSNHFVNNNYRAAMMMSTIINNSAVDVNKSGTPPMAISPPPWLMQPPTFNNKVMSYNFYQLAEEKRVSVPVNTRIEESEFEFDDEYKFVGSSHGWLALLNPRNNHLFLSNPITGRHIKLPSPDPEIKFLGIVSKLILTCSPDDDEEEECRAIMIFGPEDRLAFCHPQRRSTAWTPIGCLYYNHKRKGKITWRYRDIVFSSTHKLLFCMLETLLVMECWDFRDPIPRKCWSRWLPYYLIVEVGESEGLMFHRGGLADVWIQQCLVFQANRLFIVTRRLISRIHPDGSYPIPVYFSKYRGWDHDRFPYQTIAFDVQQVVDWDDWDDDFDQELGDQEKRLGCLYMESSLDGLAMFIGMNHSFAIEFPESMKLKPDCIYFTDTNRHPKPSSLFFGGHDIGIFHYGNRTFSPCIYPREVNLIERIVPAPMWFTPSPY